MSSHLAAVATLALAIFLSPETLVLGLIIAGDRSNPRLASFGFALGGIAGITFATGIGLAIAHASEKDPVADHHGSWPGFVVRVVIAAVLLAIGLSRAVNAARHKPIPDIAESEHQPSGMRVALTKRFPGAMRMVQPGLDLSPRQSMLRGFAGGFAMCGLHPKVFPIAIAAGHQISQIDAPGQRGLAVLVFAVIAVIPAVLPAVIDVVRPGAANRIKDGYERIMKVHGRWITAVLLLSAAAFVAHNAWEKFPAR